MEQGGYSRGFAKTELIGQLFVRKGLINAAQLDEALKFQKSKGGLLGEILVHQGLISEEVLGEALATQVDMVYIPLDKYKISKEILGIFPKNLATKYSVVPIERMDGVMTLASAEPLSPEAREAIEKQAQYKIVNVIATKMQIDKIIRLSFLMQA